jgi:hypothetical protein
MPSAVTVRPSAFANAIVAWTMAPLRGSRPSPATNERSILSVSSGNRWK